MDSDDNDDDLGLTVSLRGLGGSGRAAKWRWEVYEAGKVIAIASGVFTGAQAKARQAGEAEKRRIMERRLKETKDDD